MDLSCVSAHAPASSAASLCLNTFSLLTTPRFTTPAPISPWNPALWVADLISPLTVLKHLQGSAPKPREFLPGHRSGVRLLWSSPLGGPCWGAGPARPGFDSTFSRPLCPQVPLAALLIFILKFQRALSGPSDCELGLDDSQSLSTKPPMAGGSSDGTKCKLCQSLFCLKPLCLPKAPSHVRPSVPHSLSPVPALTSGLLFQDLISCPLPQV